MVYVNKRAFLDGGKLIGRPSKECLKKNHYSKSIRAVIFLLLLFQNSSLQSQSILNKIIDFETQDTPIADALIDLSEVADINIAFHPRLFSSSQKVSLSIKNKPLDYILKECLSATNVTFKLVGEHLILSERPKKKYTISGYIEDAKTGERLVAATIWEANSGKGSTTNNYGFFSMQIPEGKVELQAAYLGYQGEIQTYTLQKSKQIQIALEPSLTLQEIIVTDVGFEQTQAHLTLGKGEAVNLKELSATISLGGESDLMRFLSTKAGVQSGADGIGGLNVRGGNTDQNLVLMDGVPVYNPSHSLGLFSVFNTHIIKNAQFLTDGFSAKYGGRLSSILDVRVKEGNTKEWKAEGEIGTLATKFIVEGPLEKDKSGLLLAFRRTHLDPLVSRASRKEKLKEEVDGEVNYYFFDMNAKFHYRFSSKNQLYVSYYKGKDSFKDDGYYEWEDPDFGDYTIEAQEQEIEWGNEIAALRWNHLFGEQLFSNTTFTLSNYNYNSLNYYDYQDDFDGEYLANYYNYTFISKIQDAGLKIDFEFYPNSKHQLSFGGGLLFRSFKSGDVNFAVEDIESSEEFETAQESFDEVFDPPLFKTQEFNFYVEDKLVVTDKFSMLGGLHVATFWTDGKTYFIPQPRLHFKWQVNPKWTTSLSASKMAQSLHILSASGGALPNDLWVPSTSNVRPETAMQYTWNTKFESTKDWTASLDVYYKKMNHLLAYFDLAILPGLIEMDPTYWEEQITTGTGKSYGISTNITRTKGSVTGYVNYAYTVSERLFEENNEGQVYPFRFTHPHEIKTGLQYQINPKISFFANWQYGSGQPYTLFKTASRFAPLSNLPGPEEEILIGTINSHRLPSYHRLDTGFYFKWAKEHVNHSLQLGLYNAYNRKNPYFQYIREDPYFPEDNGVKQQRGLPLLPSFSYRISF